MQPYINEYLPELKRYCRMLTGTPWDGDDLYQDTLLNVIKRSSRLNDHPNPKGYLFKTATNQWRDTIKKTKREVIDGEVGIAEKITDISLIDSVEVLISLLPFKQAAIILLTEYFGFKSKDIAELLEMTNGAVKAALNRGRMTLTKMKSVQMKSNDPIPTILNRLLNSLKKNDFQSIVTTYHILVSRGVKVNRDDQFFTFELYDPDGNRFFFKEKI
ncbi:RNA polymerase sigma factor [Cytobacillus sp. Hm23]